MARRVLVLLGVLVTTACARRVPIGPARLVTPGAAVVALGAARDSAAPCDPLVQVAEVHNPLRERMWVSVVTNGGSAFLPDEPMAPDEVRWFRLPGRLRAVRAEASLEPWRVATTEASVGSRRVRADRTAPQRPAPIAVRVPVRMACPS